jgi:hypothetical protein
MVLMTRALSLNVSLKVSVDVHAPVVQQVYAFGELRVARLTALGLGPFAEVFNTDAGADLLQDQGTHQIGPHTTWQQFKACSTSHHGA